MLTNRDGTLEKKPYILIPLKSALCIIFDSELEWYHRMSVQDERCIKAVGYSLGVDVAINGLSIVASRPRFGCYSQVRTLVHSYTSAGQEPAGKAQQDRDQLYRARQVLDRKGVSNVYKYL